jgi:hypothetical protein
VREVDVYEGWTGRIYWSTWNCYQRALVPVEVALELMNAELGQHTFVEEVGRVLSAIGHVVEDLQVAEDVLLAGLEWEAWMECYG